MKKILMALAAIAAVVTLVSSSIAQAGEVCPPKQVVKAAPCRCCPPPRHHVAHKRAPRPTVSAVVEEAPAVHVTHIREVVVVHHEVVELPTHVIAPRPRPCAVCAPLPHPACSTCGPGPASFGPGHQPNVQRVGELLHKGCPAGVQIGQVFACEGPTGQCICK